MISALSNPTVIEKTILKEIANQWSIGPFNSPPFPVFVVNSIEVVPKKSGGFRMITDLSRPAEGVNHCIDKGDYSLQYASVDDAIAILTRSGTDAVMCKLDLKDAFRLVPVRKDDWPLLGYQWESFYFFHTRLPFGLRSSPFFFNRVAKLLAWIISNTTGTTGLIQYLDDFWCGDMKDMCQNTFDTFQDTCYKLGIALSPDKLEGPSSTITFLGIELDSRNQTISLPSDKLEEILMELHQWSSIKKCTKRQLLSLIGKLSFAAKCIPAGRIFFRRLIDLSMKVPKLHHHLDLNHEARADIAWWCKFLPLWNGQTRFISPVWTHANSIDLFTDAAASIGAGAYYQGRWFFIPWPQHIQDNPQLHITWMELFPIVVAARLWGHEWSQNRLLFHTDNSAVVDIWFKGSSKSPNVMVLVRHLFFAAATHNFHASICHIPGKSNILADLISRNLQEEFHRVAPQADEQPTSVPTEMLSDLFPQ